MDALFEASFTSAETSKIYTRCGKTMRYLRIINSRPPRLYNPLTEDIYIMPLGGKCACVCVCVFLLSLLTNNFTFSQVPSSSTSLCSVRFARWVPLPADFSIGPESHADHRKRISFPPLLPIVCAIGKRERSRAPKSRQSAASRARRFRDRTGTWTPSSTRTSCSQVSDRARENPLAK